MLAVLSASLMRDVGTESSIPCLKGQTQQQPTLRKVRDLQSIVYPELPTLFDTDSRLVFDDRGRPV